jgi:hypothetical protein
MTLNQAAALQVKWKQRAYRTRCTHVVLESECTEQGYWTGNYVCNFCGESVDRESVAQQRVAG